MLYMLGQTKKCSKCGVIKTLELFKLDSRRKDGYSSHCKQCAQQKSLEWRQNNRDKFNNIAKNYKLRNPEKHRDRNRSSTYKRLYGLDLDQYNQLLSKQNNCCAVCRQHQSTFNKALAVDHSHATGEVRGLLCDSCNRALGLVRDSIEVLKSMVKYLSDPVVK